MPHSWHSAHNTGSTKASTVLDIVQEQLDAFNVVNTSTAMHRFATSWGQCNAAERAALLARPQVRTS